MAPSPENDNAPKAPDKIDKNKSERAITSDNNKDNDKDEKTLSNLNDGELKALLDEAINYKNPKDREGKSKLFKDLLNQAEETERIARATSAGGSEEARHYNPSAARRHHGRHGAGADGSGGGGQHGGRRHHDRHRKPTSISENMMHGGSLDNLAKEELFLESTHCLVNKMKKVSARQREGGSLPCDVNASVITPSNLPFIKEAKKSQAAVKDKEYTAIDIESSESQRLLDHDVLAQNYQESQEITIVPRYTSKATLQISATPVDEAIALDLDNVAEKKIQESNNLENKFMNSKYSVFIPTYRSTDDRKVDENGNALHQNTKAKKKKIQTDKNVVVLTAESVEGHRGDIIDDVDKLIQFIGGEKNESSTKTAKSNVHKSKQLHKQHASEDSGRSGNNSNSKKQRAHSSKGKEPRSEIKKSNSLGEISTAKLDDFTFFTTEEGEENKVVLRGNKNQTDRPKERRSWGNVEPPFQTLSSNASTENLETAENWVVSKTKKKSKKRRNSISSSSSRRLPSTSDSNAKQHLNRVPSPSCHGKSTFSVPHSEKSDSSDADSVHSLPIDSVNVPTSYADIAKNAEKVKDKKNSPEKIEKVPNKEKSPKLDIEFTCKREKAHLNNTVGIKNPLNHVKSSPDFHGAKNYPTITVDSQKSVQLPDLSDTRSFPAMHVEVTNIKSPPISDSHLSNCPAFPPDVNDTKSFPAMPTDSAVKGRIFSTGSDFNNTKACPSIISSNTNNSNNRSLSIDKTNVKNISMSGKVRNVSPGTKVLSTKPNCNSSINIRDADSQNGVYNDIQNDLSILHSNEKESIQYNAQRLPPNIPDVQTIEKIHFMQCRSQPPPSLPQNKPNRHLSSSPLVNANTPNYLHASNQLESNQVSMDSVKSPSGNKKLDCDMGDRTMIGESNSRSRENQEEEEEGLPPVVILSGIGNKEVTGLVFGFDVNEQLLNDDICDNFIARFVPPEGYTHTSHNHDKIVNFIGSTWDAFANQSNGKVLWYKEES
ncbi:dentin sialophosphoprotein-like isoform X1 [Diorhabda sublineata]|uniref:dentin sialophosphoprotein-like isoform X1 n=1 Tax=Diorhabda sublineata TaxID=1163346 RepID=UPI0024E059E0|nr:dentin sialophosphoprotein-like isoform X1 [Diorhabda sublineata]